MDFAALLDVTQPVTVEFMGREIICNVYVAGPARLTRDERERLEEVVKPLVEISSRAKVVEQQLGLPDLTDTRKNELAKELDSLGEQMDVGKLAQTNIPLMVRDFEMDGEPMTWKGEPITHKNIHELPMLFLVTVAAKAKEVWDNPTNGAPSRNGAPATAEPEASPAENTGLLISSESLPNGSDATALN
jgi:hypothetical protein